jgi:predicted MFS family arabinose efflux permease
MASETAAQTQPKNSKSLLFAAIVIVIGVIGTTLGQPQVLGRIPLQNLLKNELHADRAANAAFFFWIGLAWYLKPLVGIVTDAFPLFGTRRKSYMIAGALLAGLAWYTLAYTPHKYMPLLLVVIVIDLFMVITSTAVGGFMVEAAQASSGPGSLSSVRNFAQQFCTLAAGPAGGFLAAMSLGFTTLACGSLMVLVVPGTLFFLREPRITVDAALLFGNTKTQLKRILKAKTMWAAAGFMLLFYCAPGIATAVFYKQQNDLHMNTQAQGYLGFLSGLFGMISAAIYGAYACRKFNLRKLLFVCMLFGTVANLAYLFYSTVHNAQIIESLNGFGYTLAEVAMMDLAVRATPAGSEGLGFSLMMSVRNLALFGSDWAGSKLLDAYHLQFSTLVIANAAITFIAVPLVLLLPRVIVMAKDSQPPPGNAEFVAVPTKSIQE